jgi:ribosomal protein S18 acetylase RimI-like enzyme
MNFYSDKIINEIIDNEPIENIIDSVETFKLQCQYYLTRYSYRTIHHKYTSAVIRDPNVIVAFYCMDQDKFDIENCPSMLIYRKIVYKTEVIYYILFTCTKHSYRGKGYGSILLDNLQKRIREENQHRSDRVLKIVLSSVENAVLFYEAYGFRWTRECITEYPILSLYERYEDNKDYFMMELIVESS